MQWPFQAWGADAVLAGHVHNYERLDKNGLPYFVNGSGGNSLYGYTFSNWSGDLTGNANPVTIVMDADKTITANCIAGGTASFQYGASGYSGTIDTFIRGTTNSNFPPSGVGR